MKIKKEEFRSSTYYLAVTLLALGEELLFIEKEENSQRATFVFKNSSALERNVENFVKGKILVEPQALFAQHKNLKGRLYNNY